MHDDVTGLSLSLTFDFCLSSSFLESRSLILATTSAVAPLLLPSAPELGTTETILAGPCEDKDALVLPSGNPATPENTMVILENPPLAQIHSSATAITIAGPSQQGSDAEFTGDPPPHSSHSQSEVV